MKRFRYKSRNQYVDAQIERSRKKYGFCKVYYSDVLRYHRNIALDMKLRGKKLNSRTTPPILCLGVRSGAELDIFRSVFFGPLMKFGPVQRYAINQDVNQMAAPKMRIAKYVGFGSGSQQDERVMGVEINPDTQRPDVHVGSFDQLPKEWTGRFGLLYSNSFDHSMDPKKTLKEWRRVASRDTFLIMAFTPNCTPSVSDPLGGISLQSMLKLVDEKVVFATEVYSRSGYHEICFRINSES